MESRVGATPRPGMFARIRYATDKEPITDDYCCRDHRHRHNCVPGHRRQFRI
jgi:hypothetical protein